MKHHFGDLLDRSGDYWTIVPNRERFSFRIDEIPEGDDPDTEWFQFLGKGAGRIKCTNPDAAKRCEEYAAEYSRMKEAARALIDSHPDRRGP